MGLSSVILRLVLTPVSILLMVSIVGIFRSACPLVNNAYIWSNHILLKLWKKLLKFRFLSFNVGDHMRAHLDVKKSHWGSFVTLFEDCCLSSSSHCWHLRSVSCVIISGENMEKLQKWPLYVYSSRFSLNLNESKFMLFVDRKSNKSRHFWSQYWVL